MQKLIETPASYIFFLVYRVKKSSLIILYLILYSAHDKNLTYIVDFSSLQSEKSQLWSFFISYSIRHAAEVWHTSYIFWVWGVKYLILVILYLVLYSANDKNVTYIVDFSSLQSEKSHQLWSFYNLYSIRHAAEMWHNYIVHCLGSQSEKSGQL